MWLHTKLMHGASVHTAHALIHSCSRLSAPLEKRLALADAAADPACMQSLARMSLTQLLVLLTKAWMVASHQGCWPLSATYALALAEDNKHTHIQPCCSTTSIHTNPFACNTAARKIAKTPAAQHSTPSGPALNKVINRHSCPTATRWAGKPLLLATNGDHNQAATLLAADAPLWLSCQVLPQHCLLTSTAHRSHPSSSHEEAQCPFMPPTSGR
jgi:hypothetical protein